MSDLTNKIFSVTFKRRRDAKDGSARAGDLRHMLARMGVKKHLKGGELPYDPAEKSLLIVWDLQKKGYKSIPTDAIVEFKCGEHLIDDLVNVTF